MIQDLNGFSTRLGRDDGMAEILQHRLRVQKHERIIINCQHYKRSILDGFLILLAMKVHRYSA